MIESPVARGREQVSRPHARLLIAFLLVIPAFGCLQIMPALAPSARDVEPGLGDDFPFESRYLTVLGSRMHYVDEGAGPPVVLLHGNPTSVYLWRNVIPTLAERHRVIAVDLIGMGKSAKPTLGYRFADHARFFEAFMQELGVRDVALVLHDWGGAVGIDYAARQPENVRAISVMEAVLKPMSWDQADMATRYLFSRLRDPEDGHEIVAVENYFVERMLPMMSGRDLSVREMEAYREPFPTVESRRPVEQWPREIPIDDVPADNAQRIASNYEWLRQSDLPVQLLHADPGMIIDDAFVENLQREIPRIQTVEIGSGIHYLQEVQPTRIARAVSSWLQALDAR